MPRLTAERRRALMLLAGNQRGTNEALLVLVHGFSRPVLAGLIASGFAAAEREVVDAGDKSVEVRRIRITAAGREALAKG
jgi:hypothetical protein